MLSFSRCARAALVLAVVATAVASAQNRHGVGLFNPTDLGLLESPDRDNWQKPDQIMDSLGIADGAKVADVGAGGGYFTVRLARRVGPNGTVWAEDVQAAMLEAIKRRVAKENLRNVRYGQGTGVDPLLPAGTLDAVLIVETYREIQYGNPLLFLRNVRAALREGGRLGIVDYKKGDGGPGPDGARPDPDTIIAVAERAGLRLAKRESFLPFQFFLVFVK
ncbi:MAG TPA: class I SAM-dependent methyltransferase [Vicinamibacterales bacterium]|jgi:ubiquinone/menaquinone biosynthesis C-methylase UbiE